MFNDENKTLRTVAWSQICPWLVILRTFRLAISFRTMLLAGAAAFLTLCGWTLLGNVFYEAEDPDRPDWTSPASGCPWTAIDQSVENYPRLPGGADFQEALLEPTAHSGTPGNPFYGTWLQLSRPLLEAVRLDSDVSDLACMLLCGLWSLAVWAFFGAAITRIAAVQLAADERIGWGAALRFAGSKWVSFFSAPLFPVIGILLAAFPVWVVGSIMWFGSGWTWLAAVFWPLALLAGWVMARVILGLLFGWPLMWATVATEGKDSFDALQRSYDYVLHRPLHYLFYAAVAAVLGGLGWLLVEGFTAGVVGLSYWSAGWLAGEELVTVNGSAEVVQPLVRFWGVCLKLLAVGYIYGFFWTASVAIYLLLRRDTDATEMDEVFLDEDADEQPYGLPSLTADEAGAPAVEEDIPEVEPDE